MIKSTQWAKWSPGNEIRLIASSYRVYPGTPAAGMWAIADCPSDNRAIRMLQQVSVWGIDSSLSHRAVAKARMEGGVPRIRAHWYCAR
ncbi:hypothetical protein IG631_18214 [Alternaria alternata]|nr:hypothetical protein IG631_18214 [Alternaria alternata]